MRNIIDPLLPNVYLEPGDLYLSRIPALVSTVLGSCISVTMHCPEHRIGGICHAMLPEGHGDQGFRFVDTVVPHMYKTIVMLCGSQSLVEVKLFGGADVLLRYPADRSIGGRNVEVAVNVINSLGLALAAQDTGGVMGRKLFFYTSSGKVYLRKIRRKIVGQHVASEGDSTCLRK